MKRLALIAPILVLAACEAPSTTGATAAAPAQGGEARGVYDPATTSRDQLIARIMGQCPSGGFDHLLETQRGDGTRSYTATCT